MSATDLKLAVIIASVRTGRFGPVAACWLLDEARQHGQFDVELIDLADHELPSALPPEPPMLVKPETRPASLRELTKQLSDADAFVVVTPEYNHSFPASVKHLIDWHFTEWRAKPVGFVSYGGLAGGLRAVEQLRLVFAELHAVTMRDTVSFHSYWEQFDAEGHPVNPTAANGAAKIMLDQLAWWGAVLHEARQTTPDQLAG
jgi:NAD(P)H-dependent FMN reductase